MSSEDEEYVDGDTITAENASGSRTRKIQRACDICRRKKSMLDHLLLVEGVYLMSGFSTMCVLPATL